MRARSIFSLVLSAALSIIPASLWSHCEIPCGIYDDSMRYDMLNEDVVTIEKSMDMIVKLSTEGEKNYNQIVRWVNNKEEHADKFMDIVWQYFMTQRIKPVPPDSAQAYKEYVDQLTTLHEMLVYAMKCKQTVDTANTTRLKELVASSRQLYFKER